MDNLILGKLWMWWISVNCHVVYQLKFCFQAIIIHTNTFWAGNKCINSSVDDIILLV